MYIKYKKLFLILFYIPNKHKQLKIKLFCYIYMFDHKSKLTGPL